MKTHRFHQLDVFSDKPLRGNPLAVVHSADDLDEMTMAGFARWTNLSETTFLLTSRHPEADYRVRIFTPGGELPFAGHPTLGSCYAWLAGGGIPRHPDYIVQECELGLVRIRKDGARLAFAAPPLLKRGPVDEILLARAAAGLGLHREEILQHQWVDNGPGWFVLMLDSAERVLSLTPEVALLSDLKFGIIGPHKAMQDSDYEVRAFVVPLGITEDPVTGSLNAGIAMWLIETGLAKPAYVVSQGTALQRSGRVFVDKVGDDIWVGGYVATCVEGSVRLPG
ncbi:phenazine biosynthesis protein PhzF [Kineobactrum sediminis]|uniref:Phenazine biosynthesis protein PhzF n=1 Tax=Kineobactrum sediminis TaxID=1905677 RepID=A0A2N5Y4Z2_9GAMM|nr:PhzF family phenazine biosynthesis protein [Kineobactrum sediminis]PLW83458.1 phenazine biosynthesis protein PhzF [Kineobactrum sediminis]